MCEFKLWMIVLPTLQFIILCKYLPHSPNRVWLSLTKQSLLCFILFHSRLTTILCNRIYSNFKSASYHTMICVYSHFCVQNFSFLSTPFGFSLLTKPILNALTLNPCLYLAHHTVCSQYMYIFPELFFLPRNPALHSCDDSDSDPGFTKLTFLLTLLLITKIFYI